MYVSSAFQIFVLTPFAVLTYQLVEGRSLHYYDTCLHCLYDIGAVACVVSLCVYRTGTSLSDGFWPCPYACVVICASSVSFPSIGGTAITRRKLKVVNRARLAFFLTTYFILCLLVSCMASMRGTKKI